MDEHLGVASAQIQVDAVYRVRYIQMCVRAHTQIRHSPMYSSLLVPAPCYRPPAACCPVVAGGNSPVQSLLQSPAVLLGSPCASSPIAGSTVSHPGAGTRLHQQFDWPRQPAAAADRGQGAAGAASIGADASPPHAPQMASSLMLLHRCAGPAGQGRQPLPLQLLGSRSWVAASVCSMRCAPHARCGAACVGCAHVYMHLPR